MQQEKNWTWENIVCLVLSLAAFSVKVDCDCERHCHMDNWWSTVDKTLSAFIFDKIKKIFWKLLCKYYCCFYCKSMLSVCIVCWRARSSSPKIASRTTAGNNLINRFISQPSKKGSWRYFIAKPNRRHFHQFAKFYCFYFLHSGRESLLIFTRYLLYIFPAHFKGSFHLVYQFVTFTAGPDFSQQWKSKMLSETEHRYLSGSIPRRFKASATKKKLNIFFQSKVMK